MLNFRWTSFFFSFVLTELLNKDVFKVFNKKYVNKKAIRKKTFVVGKKHRDEI